MWNDKRLHFHIRHVNDAVRICVVELAQITHKYYIIGAYIVQIQLHIYGLHYSLFRLSFMKHSAVSVVFLIDYKNCSKLTDKSQLIFWRLIDKKLLSTSPTKTSTTGPNFLQHVEF